MTDLGERATDLVDLLPHRPPFRFVDVVDELVPGQLARARYRVRGDEPFLAGHFPGRPVFPGVIQLEALAQTGALAVLALDRYAGSLPLFGGVDAVRFRRQVVPGDELELRVEVRHLSARAGRASGAVTVGGARACTAELLFVLAPDGGNRRDPLEGPAGGGARDRGATSTGRVGSTR